MSNSKALTNTQIIRAALIVLLGFAASGVLGVVRTGAISAIFGTSAELDAFYAAQRIPEMLFVLVAGGALGSSFIPVFSRYLSDDNPDRAWRLASAVMTLSTLAAAALGFILALLAPVIVPHILFPGRPPDQQQLATSLTQFMLITTVIFAISGLAMGILNAHQKFLFPALAMSFYNIGMITGAVLIAPNLAAYTGQTTEANVYGLAIGAILGASLHLAIQLPGLYRIKAKLHLSIDWRVPGVKEVLTLMGPRMLGLAVVQINFAVNVMFASSMVEGSLVALNTAWFLAFFTLGVIAQSVGTAVFPSLSALVAENDMNGYKERLSAAMRSVLFLAFPATVGLMVLGEPIVAVFERGEWTVESTRATAWALTFFAIGLAGHSLLEILSRAFYALHDTWTPVKIGLAAMISNIILSLIFIQIIGNSGSPLDSPFARLAASNNPVFHHFVNNPSYLERGPFAGLALANSLTTLLESATLWWLIRRRIGGVNDRYVLNGAGRALLAALGMGVIVLGMSSLLNQQSSYLQLIVGLGTGGVSFLILALILRLEELDILLRRFKLKRS
jgi:putative peptidoglycan lipid II flippase